jgi:hypothetical protein
MDFSNLLAEFQKHKFLLRHLSPLPHRGRRCERSDGATATALEFTALPATANSPSPSSAPAVSNTDSGENTPFPVTTAACNQPWKPAEFLSLLVWTKI